MLKPIYSVHRIFVNIPPTWRHLPLYTERRRFHRMYSVAVAESVTYLPPQKHHQSETAAGKSRMCCPKRKHQTDFAIYSYMQNHSDVIAICRMRNILCLAYSAKGDKDSLYNGKIGFFLPYQWLRFTF